MRGVGIVDSAELPADQGDDGAPARVLTVDFKLQIALNNAG